MRTSWRERRVAGAARRRDRNVRAIANSLPKGSRDILVGHLDGGWVHNIAGSGRRRHNLNVSRSVGVLCRADLLERSADFPFPTRITEAGREVLSALLADYADALTSAGAIGQRQRDMVAAFLRVVAKESERHREPA